MSYTVIMEKGHQKSKRLSYMAKFQQEVVRCAEEKGGNRDAAAVFGFDERNVRLRWKHKQKSGSVRGHGRNSLGPRKDDFL
jgi:hypothetical protein